MDLGRFPLAEDLCFSIMYSIVQVLCIVKPLAAARYSQIRYQAVVVWTGSDKSMPQVNVLILHTILRRHFQEFSEMFSSRQRRQDMGVSLKSSYDLVKSALRLDRALSMPGRPETVLVPALVNLLPKYAAASVTGYECPENTSIGLILLTVNPSRHEDKSVKCFVLFHLEDVVDEGGNPAFLNSSTTIKSLKNVQVAFY